MGVEHTVPKARTEDLIVKDMADEVLVYDLKRHNAHCLNRAAALVWRHCDGRRNTRDLAQIVTRELHTPVDEEMVWYALGQLGKFHLLETAVAMPPGTPRMNRRDFIRKAGITAAVTVPVVLSIVSPTPAHAVTCSGTGGPCVTGADCCAGCVCTGNLCVGTC